VVDFLKTPERYRARRQDSQGRTHRGSTGTGKTLLAGPSPGAKCRLILERSEFVEMFVGVGAARVRDLFSKPRNWRPASSSSTNSMRSAGRERQRLAGNEEREQTLNQRSFRWMASTPAAASSSWPPPTAPKFSIRAAASGTFRPAGRHRSARHPGREKICGCTPNT